MGNDENRQMMENNPYIKGNESVREAISALVKDNNYDNFVAVVDTLIARIEAGGHFILQAVQQEGEEGYRVSSVRSQSGEDWLAVFTDLEEYEKAKGETDQAYTQYMAQILVNAQTMDSIAGVVINPFGDSFSINKNMIEMFGIQLVDPEEAGIATELLN